MTWQFLNLLELFSPSKSKLSNFRSLLVFIFNQKVPQSCQFFYLLMKSSVYVFHFKNRSKNTFIFGLFQLIVTYLLNSLAKICTSFNFINNHWYEAPQPSINQLVFQENKIYTFKIHFFDFKTPNKQMLTLFRAKMRKSLIWQIFSGAWESDFKNLLTKHLIFNYN